MLSLETDRFPLGIVYRNENKPSLQDEIDFIHGRFAQSGPVSLETVFDRYR
jgi:hypothetical protein